MTPAERLLTTALVAFPREDVLGQDVVSGARDFRLAVGGWAKDYQATCRLASAPANDTADTARADLRRWSSQYFADIS